MSKFFCNVLDRRLVNFQSEVGISCAEQFGFVKDRCTLDACFILDTVIDSTIASNKCLYVAFIDFQKAYDFIPREALFFKMLHAHMNGPVLRVLYNMYKYVYSVVQLGLSQLEVISQMVGLRQGCILSPCLFSFYIADFPDFLARRTGDQRCEGVICMDTIMHVLMYADDMALVALSAEDLQRMLDALYDYCSLWRMFVNVKKTKVVIFHKCASSVTAIAEKDKLNTLHEHIHSSYSFTYNSQQVDIVSEFKYLGLIFSEKVEQLRKPSHTNNPWPRDVKVARKYSICIYHRIKQGRAALAVWMRRVRVWSLPIDVAVNMFRTCVMPSVEYGCGLWGPGLIHNECKDQIESFWIGNARFILHAPLRTPIEAIQGELGWTPFSIRAKSQAISFLVRATVSRRDSLLYKSICMQRDMLKNGHACWLANVAIYMQNTGDTLCKSMWDQWWQGGTFDTLIYNCSSDDALSDYISLRPSCVIPIRNEFHQIFESEWLHEVQRIHAKRGNGLNKLRTYARFKSDCRMEPYLMHIKHECKRILLFKFRSGIAPLRIETGRYESNVDILTKQQKKGIPADCRTCLCCFSGVECEQHFLLECPLYKSIRTKLISIFHTYCNDNNICYPNCNDDLFIALMACKDGQVINELAKYIWEAFNVRENILCP